MGLLSHKQPEKKGGNKKHNDECLKIGFHQTRHAFVCLPESEIFVKIKLLISAIDCLWH